MIVSELIEKLKEINNKNSRVIMMSYGDIDVVEVGKTDNEHPELVVYLVG